MPSLSYFGVLGLKKLRRSTIDSVFSWIFPVQSQGVVRLTNQFDILNLQVEWS